MDTDLVIRAQRGDEEAFDRLLSLLDDDFSTDSLDSEAARIRMARHFVQRRRIDITGREWGEERTFPRHETVYVAGRQWGEPSSFNPLASQPDWPV